jgi:hypothetical protein
MTSYFLYVIDQPSSRGQFRGWLVRKKLVDVSHYILYKKLIKSVSEISIRKIITEIIDDFK